MYLSWETWLGAMLIYIIALFFLQYTFGKESDAALDFLLRSLSRSLYPDGDMGMGRRLVQRDEGSLFGDSPEPD